MEKEKLGKDEVWKGYFEDIPECLQKLVSDYKINVIDIRNFENTKVFQTDVKQVFDFIRCSKDKEKLLELVENDEYFSHMEEDAFEVVTQYTKSKELVEVKNYESIGGKRDVCKAIKDLMEDSKMEGREEGRESTLKIAISNLLKENCPLDMICRILECDEAYVEQVRSTFG